MFLRLLLLLTVVPLVELWLLLRVHEATSLAFTLGLVVLTGIVGAALAKRQGLATLRQIRDELGAGRMPTTSLQDGMLILLAGALLVTPGLLTDALGFSLLIPFTRGQIRHWLARRWRSSFRVQTFHNVPHSEADLWNNSRPAVRDKVIDVRVVDPPGDSPSGE